MLTSIDLQNSWKTSVRAPNSTDVDPWFLKCVRLYKPATRGDTPQWTCRGSEKEAAIAGRPNDAMPSGTSRPMPLLPPQSARCPSPERSQDQPTPVYGRVSRAAASRRCSFACSVASLSRSPGHYQPGHHSFRRVAPAECHLGWDKPSTCSAARSTVPNAAAATPHAGDREP